MATTDRISNGSAVAAGEILDDELLPRVGDRRLGDRLLRRLVLHFGRLRLSGGDEWYGRRKQVSQLAACFVVADDRRYREESRAPGQCDHQSNGCHRAVAHVQQKVQP